MKSGVERHLEKEICRIAKRGSLDPLNLRERAVEGHVTQPNSSPLFKSYFARVS
jgi:hypothetical protein